jgi:hypothetical protein
MIAMHRRNPACGDSVTVMHWTPVVTQVKEWRQPLPLTSLIAYLS